MEGCKIPVHATFNPRGRKMEVNSSRFTLVNQTYRLDKDRLDLSIQQEPRCRNVHKGYRIMSNFFTSLLASCAFL